MSVSGLVPVSFPEGHCMEHLYAHVAFWFSVLTGGLYPQRLTLQTPGARVGQLLGGRDLHHHRPHCPSQFLGPRGFCRATLVGPRLVLPCTMNSSSTGLPSVTAARVLSNSRNNCGVTRSCSQPGGFCSLVVLVSLLEF